MINEGRGVAPPKGGPKSELMENLQLPRAAARVHSSLVNAPQLIWKTVKLLIHNSTAYT